MVDKYRVISVKSPMALFYIDTFADWTELELVPFLGPAAAAIGGFDARFKMLISPKTNNELTPAKGDIIEMSLWMLARYPPQPAETPVTQHPAPGTIYGSLQEIIAQLKRLNTNMEKKQ